MEALGHIVWDVHMHEHKAFNMWVEPTVEREERYMAEAGTYTSSALQVWYRKLRILRILN